MPSAIPKLLLCGRSSKISVSRAGMTRVFANDEFVTPVMVRVDCRLSIIGDRSCTKRHCLHRTDGRTDVDRLGVSFSIVHPCRASFACRRNRRRIRLRTLKVLPRRIRRRTRARGTVRRAGCGVKEPHSIRKRRERSPKRTNVALNGNLYTL